MSAGGPADVAGRPRRHGPRLGDAAAAAALAALVVVVFALSWQRTDLRAWSLPTRYSGDDVHGLGVLRAARDGHIRPLVPLRVPELGAPAGANWNGFLRQHKPQYLLAGALARVTSLFLAANLLLLSAHLLAALSFFGAARYLRARTEWALAGALLFAFSRFMYYRGFGHLTVAACWPIPLAAIVLAWCSSRRPLALASRRFAAALAVTVLVGFHNIYFAALYAQLLALAGAVRATRLARWRELRLPALLLAVLAASVALDNANQVVDRLAGGPGEVALLRPYGNLERFALKPLELVLPTPGTGLLVPESVTRAYWEGSLYRGEMGSAYLGLAGVGALLWLLARGLAGWARARRSGALAPLLVIAYVLLFSVVGGLNGLVGTLGFVWLRASNRFSAWILAVALLTAVTRLGAVRWLARRPWSGSAAALAVVIGLLDQVPGRGHTAADPALVGRSVASDRAFVASVEALLPQGGALFVEPAAEFPESRRLHQAPDYEQLRPYLHSTRLRFSYGTDKNRPGAAWAMRIDELATPERARRLEALGFSGLLLTCRALEDGGEELLRELAATGYVESVRSADGHFVFVRLARRG